jgi:hypothetical protein
MGALPLVEVLPFVEELHFVGAPPSGRWVVICEALSRRGSRASMQGFTRAQTGKS